MNTEFNSKQFGEKIRELRKKKDISQEAIAFQKGVGQKNISDLEAGNIKPKIEDLLFFSNAYEVNPMELLELDEKVQINKISKNQAVNIGKATINQSGIDNEERETLKKIIEDLRTDIQELRTREQKLIEQIMSR